MTTLLIDADGLAFKAAAAAQKDFDWGDVTSTVTDIDGAKDHFHGQVLDIMMSVGSNQVILCWSCPSRRYFRHDVLPEYKGHRKGQTPVLRDELRAWAEQEYPSKWKPHLEADDVLGILATNPKLVPGPKIIVSEDKDLLQVPGQHFRYGLHNATTHEFAEWWLWMQVLMGDPTDGFKGIPKVGPKKAAKILETRRPDQPYFDVVLDAYLKAGLTAEYLAQQINVARILQHGMYDYKRKEPRLWQM